MVTLFIYIQFNLHSQSALKIAKFNNLALKYKCIRSIT